MLPGETPRQSRNAWLLVGALVLGVGAAGLAWNEWGKTRYGPDEANITAITEAVAAIQFATFAPATTLVASDIIVI